MKSVILDCLKLSVLGIIGYVLLSMFMIIVPWYVGEGAGIIGLIIIPILAISVINEISSKEAKTKLSYIISNITLTIYIIATLIARIIDYKGLDSIAVIILHSIAIITNVLILIRETFPELFNKKKSE